MKSKMILVLIIALVAMAGFATANVDMTIYDRNDDGVVDATERVNLDIDIEDSRLAPAESYVIDSYTTDGTLILNDEFQAAFLNPEAYPRGGETTVVGPVDSGPVVTPEPIPEPEPVVTPEPEVTPEVTPEVEPENNNDLNMTVVYVVLILLAVGLVIYFYNKRDKSE